MIELDAEQVLHVRAFLSVTAGILVLFVGKVLNERSRRSPRITTSRSP